MEQENPQPKKEKPSKKLKQVSDWTSLLRNFATIIASFISVVTLFILIKQNERTYRPDLVFKPEQGVFRVRYRETPRNCGDIQIGGASDTLPADVALVASNIGMGAAKNIHFQWQFDAVGMADTVMVGSVAIHTEAKYVSDLEALAFANCYHDEPMGKDVEFCLPVGQEKTPLSVGLPQTYLTAWSNILARTAHLPGADLDRRRDLLLEAIGKFQSLRLTATYHDINERLYSKKYRVWMAPAYVNLAAKEMIVSWGVVEDAGNAAPPGKHKMTLTDEHGSTTIANIKW